VDDLDATPSVVSIEDAARSDLGLNIACSGTGSSRLDRKRCGAQAHPEDGQECRWSRIWSLCIPCRLTGRAFWASRRHLTLEVALHLEEFVGEVLGEVADKVR